MHQRRGVTLSELLVAISVIVLLLALGWLVVRPPVSAEVARELARLVRHARWAAVTSGRPTVLLAADEGRSVVFLRDVGWSCDAAGSVEHAWEAAGRLASVAWPVRGVAFAPDGFPRSCTGDGVGSATVLVRDAHAGAAVVVSSLGRVRWERRP